MDNFKAAILRSNMPGVVFKILTPADVEGVQQFLVENSDFAMLESGQPARPGDGLKVFSDRPPSKSADDKCVIGLYQRNRLVALLDILRDYPGKGIWWIGLLLIHPDYRHAGLGGKVYLELEKAITAAGAREIRLGVLQVNSSGLHFWTRQGFMMVEEKPGMVFGSKTHTVLVLSRLLQPFRDILH